METEPWPGGPIRPCPAWGCLQICGVHLLRRTHSFILLSRAHYVQCGRQWGASECLWAGEGWIHSQALQTVKCFANCKCQVALCQNSPNSKEKGSRPQLVPLLYLDFASPILQGWLAGFSPIPLPSKGLSTFTSIAVVSWGTEMARLPPATHHLELCHTSWASLPRDSDWGHTVAHSTDWRWEGQSQGYGESHWTHSAETHEAGCLQKKRLHITRIRTATSPLYSPFFHLL